MLDNPSDQEVKQLLGQAKRIAVVGLSDKPERDSFRVARYLQDHGYEIIPVNPRADEILGQKAYPDLASVPVPVDVVNVFRRSDAVPEIAEAAVKIKPKALWMQLDVQSQKAAELARGNGIMVVQNACLKIEHHRLMF
ncbi:MAG: CoA-binding protein [Desulfarculaceae bacterium]|nr:CoA-binding protein [Desulfarculaceae bacterium]MCF8047774.1 CoA-binding protein [Desulfarculaceae bacterium]MCF8122412.1 CoA-binding protein [Desulfarculaceae bacterium]